MIGRARSPLIIILRGRRTKIGRDRGRDVWHWITIEIGEAPSSPSSWIKRVVSRFGVVSCCRVVTVPFTVVAITE